MSLVETLHAEHKARLARIDRAAKQRPVAVPRVSVGTIRPNTGWPNMWFWDLVRPWHIKAPTHQTPVRRIIGIVSRHYGVPPMEVTSARRTADIVLPRQVCIYLIRHCTPISTPQIGRALGGRDHTTVLHALKRIDMYLARSEEMRDVIDKLTQEIQRYETAPRS